MPSHLYSFSFAPNPDWTAPTRRQPEICAYLRAAPSATASCRTSASATSCSTAALGRRTRSAGASRPRAARFTADVLVLGDRAAQRAVDPRPPGPRALRGRRRSTRRAGTTTTTSTASASPSIGTGASAIQFVPADRAARRRAAPLPAHAAVDHAAPRPADLKPLRAPPATARCPLAQRLVRARHLLGARAASCSASVHPRVMRGGRARRPAPPAAPGPPTRRCAPSSRRPTAWAASACSSPTTTCPALAADNVEVVTDAIARGPRALDRAAPTAPSARSTPSSSAPASTSPTCRRPSACAGATAARWTRCGTAARRPTWARRSPASRTSSSCSAPTRASGTPRWST